LHIGTSVFLHQALCEGACIIHLPSELFPPPSFGGRLTVFFCTTWYGKITNRATMETNGD